MAVVAGVLTVKLGEDDISFNFRDLFGSVVALAGLALIIATVLDTLFMEHISK